MTVAEIMVRRLLSDAPGRALCDGDPGVLMAGERLHTACLQQIITNDTIRLSRTLDRRSRRLIEEDSRRRMREGHGWPPLEAL